MNMLFIPHVPNTSVVNRVYEFAKNTNSYYLYWHMKNESLLSKIKSQLRCLKFKIVGKRVEIPIVFKPEKLALYFNTFILNRVIDKLGINVVINANALLFNIRDIKVPVIYDLVDDHLTENEELGLNKKRVEKIKNDIRCSLGVICVTESLEEKVRRLNRNTITIENGVYISRFKKGKSLKKEMGLEGKKVFGFVGNIDKWTGLEKAIREYLRIRNESNAFIVVGSGGKFFRKLVRKYSDYVYFVGQINPEMVVNYFKTIDVGLIPFELNDFTNNSLPIKALEYGLAGSNVISTPLKVLKKKKFPFVHFCEINNFHRCMLRDFKTFHFDFKEYDWKKKSERLVEFVYTLLRNKRKSGN